MKKITTIFLPVILTFMIGLYAYAQAPRLHVSGNKIVDPCGNEVMLKGVAMPDPSGLTYGYDNGWGSPSVNTIIDRATDHSKGFYANAIRMQIEPVNNTSVGYQYYDVASHDAWFNNYIKPAVDYITNKGMYVIIDWHYINNTYGSDGNKDVDAWTREFWTFMGPKLKDYSNVIYEVFNEPIDGGTTWADYKNRVQPWVNIIRNAAPSTPIMVGGPSWDQEIQGAASNPFNDNNIIYVTHIYTFHNFNDLSSKALQVKANYPVILGEWGWDSNNDGYGISKNTSYPAQVKSFIDNNHISFMNWWAAGGDNFDLCLWKSDWTTVRPGNGYAGETMGSWLTEYKDKFNACTGSSGKTITIRARGNCGSERIELQINNSAVKSWTLTTTATDYTYSGYASGNIKVAFTNDATGSCDLNAFIDYIKVDNTSYQTETTATRTGCGDSQWLWCNGNFDFGSLGSATTNSKYEAESAILTGTNAATSCGGYSGASYVTGLDASGDKIDFSVNVGAAGSYTLTMRYSVCNDQYNDVKVNGTLVGGSSTSFPLNGKTGCCTWQDKAVTISLNNGTNTVTILKNWGYTAIDYIIVSNSGARVKTTEGEVPQVGQSNVYPNPANDLIKVMLPVSESNEVMIHFIDFSGRSVSIRKHYVQPSQTSLEVDTREIPTGNYLIRTTKGGSPSQSKIRIEH